MTRPLFLAVAGALLALGFAACGPTDPQTRRSAGAAASDQATPMTVSDFSAADADLSAWHIQNDGVMGGRSEGHMRLADGALAFDGTLVTEGGGFSSVLREGALDLSGAAAVEVLARGDGRRYDFALHDGSRDRGREVWWRAPFTPGEDFAAHRVAFADLRATAHGEPLPGAQLDLSSVALAGFYIIDGRDGPFRLEVREVRAVE